MTIANTKKMTQAINHSQAIKLIQQHAESINLNHELVPITAALKRISAADIAAPIAVPADACSSMDGYAVNISELQTTNTSQANKASTVGYSLELGEAIHAKQQAKKISCKHRALPIMTGGLMPVDADGVVLKEHGQIINGRLVFEKSPKKGQYIRLPGSDIQQGQIVIKANKTLCAASLGLLSSLGEASVMVSAKPKVALLMTGDELVQPGGPCLPGQVYDANAVMLKNQLQEMGAEVSLLQPLEDAETAVNQRLNELSNANYDVVISVGGVSMGEKDWVPKALAKQGRVVFHKLRIKPGFPMLFGTLGDALYFGLPGNPVSSFTTLCQYVLPAIRFMTGQSSHLTNWPAILAQDIKKSHLRREYMRGMFVVDHEGKLQVTVCGKQHSSRIASLSEANCFIVLDESQQDLTAGTRVVIQPFEGFRA